MTEYELTADDIKAIRAADHCVSFRWNRDGDDRVVMTLAKAMPVPAGWTGDHPSPVYREIDLGTMQGDCAARVERYYTPRMKAAKAFWTVSSPKYNPTWGSIARALKVGDRIKLHWQVNADATEAAIDAGFRVESFVLVVRRGPWQPYSHNRKERIDQFLLGVQVREERLGYHEVTLVPDEPTYVLTAAVS